MAQANTSTSTSMHRCHWCDGATSAPLFRDGHVMDGDGALRQIYAHKMCSRGDEEYTRSVDREDFYSDM